LNEKHDPLNADHEKSVDAKIERDWEEVEARRADITSRLGGDSRRQAILKRAGFFKRAS
jgi:hypothetical protein